MHHRSRLRRLPILQLCNLQILVSKLFDDERARLEGSGTTAPWRVRIWWIVARASGVAW